MSANKIKNTASVPKPDAEKTVDSAEIIPQKSEKPASCGFCIYLGPSIRTGFANGAIFNGTKAKVLKENEAIISRYPRIAALLIPGDEVSAARTKIQTPGNYLYEQYNKLAEQII